MIVGCYSLDLYCDGGSSCPHRKRYHEGADAQFTAEHGSTCRKKARNAGWFLTTGTDGGSVAYCRDCKSAARKLAKKGRR